MCFHDKYSVISQVLRLHWTYSLHSIQTGTLSFAKLAIFTELVENILWVLSKLGSKVTGKNIANQVVTQHQLPIKTGYVALEQHFYLDTWGQPGLFFLKNCYWLQNKDQIFRTLFKKKKNNKQTQTLFLVERNCMPVNAFTASDETSDLLFPHTE